MEMYTGDTPNDPCYERESRSQEELEMHAGDRPNDPGYERESRSQEQVEMYTGDRPNDIRSKERKRRHYIGWGKKKWHP
jgi:hypothetical protein